MNEEIFLEDLAALRNRILLSHLPSLRRMLLDLTLIVGGGWWFGLKGVSRLLPEDLMLQLDEKVPLLGGPFLVAFITTTFFLSAYGVLVLLQYRRARRAFRNATDGLVDRYSESLGQSPKEG
ncbi:hypothetical protein QQM79_06100 [Marinobacteraceae bacterium S3BR75-40.1]